MLDQLSCHKKDFAKQFPWLGIKRPRKKKKSNSALKKVVSDAQIQRLLDQLDRNPAIKDSILDLAFDRLRRLTRKMFRSYRILHQWIDSDDVFQSSLIRFYRALDQTEVRSVKHFFRLAAVQIKRELIDLLRHYFGPQGILKNQHTEGKLDQIAEELDDLESWEEFHQKIAMLPDKEREVFGLVYYKDLEQLQVAEVLDISERTVRNRWTNAKTLLAG